MSETPSAFSVSHYVLLFIVSTLCTISVVWVLIAANNREAAIHDNILRYQDTKSKTCQRQIADKITALWTTDYKNVPLQYKRIEQDYANRVVLVRTIGSCNGQRFVCEMGEVRSACDPCAENSAEKRAMFQHISDEIDSGCKSE